MAGEVESLRRLPKMLNCRQSATASTAALSLSWGFEAR